MTASRTVFLIRRRLRSSFSISSATASYFETEFNYDEVLKPPRPGSSSDGGTGPGEVEGT